MHTLKDHFSLVRAVTEEVDQAIRAHHAGNHDEFRRILGHARLRSLKTIATLRILILYPGSPAALFYPSRCDSMGQFAAYQLCTRFLALAVPEGARPVCL
jgi:hypothetical protein